MNVFGLRMQLAPDPETGLPLDRLHVRARGVLRFWRWKDRSRDSLPDTHELEFTIPLLLIPVDRAMPALILPGASRGILQVDPHKDLWSAPASVEWLLLTVCQEPERLEKVRPRPDDWTPDIP